MARGALFNPEIVLGPLFLPEMHKIQWIDQWMMSKEVHYRWDQISYRNLKSPIVLPFHELQIPYIPSKLGYNSPRPISY